MSKVMKPQDATTWEELRSCVTLDEVKTALKAKEAQRIYHKSAYLKRQLMLKKAYELGLDKEL